MKRKGFTLVELLGVIVVLAIIALIAVPTILGIIEKSRKGSLQNSGYGLVEAGTLYNAQYQNSKTIRFDIKDNEVTSKEENKLSYKGSIKEGTVLINNKGQVVVCINDGKYAAYKNFKDNKVTIVDNKTCTIPENSNIVYLDNEATIDINLEDLVAEINSLKQKVEEQSTKIEQLENIKTSQTEMTNQIINLNNTHNVDMATVNNKLGTADLKTVGDGTITGAIWAFVKNHSDYQHMTTVGTVSNGTTITTKKLTYGSHLCAISSYSGSGRREAKTGLYLIGVHAENNSFQYREITPYTQLKDITYLNSNTLQFNFNTLSSYMVNCMFLF